MQLIIKNVAFVDLLPFLARSRITSSPSKFEVPVVGQAGYKTHVWLSQRNIFLIRAKNGDIGYVCQPRGTF